MEHKSKKCICILLVMFLQILTTCHTFAINSSYVNCEGYFFLIYFPLYWHLFCRRKIVCNKCQMPFKYQICLIFYFRWKWRKKFNSSFSYTEDGSRIYRVQSNLSSALLMSILTAIFGHISFSVNVIDDRVFVNPSLFAGHSISPHFSDRRFNIITANDNRIKRSNMAANVAYSM